MVLDITRWLSEHPGGSMIIPEQVYFCLTLLAILQSIERPGQTKLTLLLSLIIILQLGRTELIDMSPCFLIGRLYIIFQSSYYFRLSQPQKSLYPFVSLSVNIIFALEPIRH
jgi:hypothetical protein